jgi:hypothetical protein
MGEDRATVLLKAVLDIFDECDKGPHVKDIFEQTTFYDGSDCDAFCLRDDIKSYLEEKGPNTPLTIQEAGEIADKIERFGIEHDRFLNGPGLPDNSLVVFRYGNITSYTTTTGK